MSIHEKNVSKIISSNSSSEEFDFILKQIIQFVDKYPDNHSIDLLTQERPISSFFHTDSIPADRFIHSDLKLSIPCNRLKSINVVIPFKEYAGYFIFPDVEFVSFDGTFNSRVFNQCEIKLISRIALKEILLQIVQNMLHSKLSQGANFGITTFEIPFSEFSKLEVQLNYEPSKNEFTLKKIIQLKNKST